MESMRSLDTSLPRSRRRKQSSQPPEQLVQAFKSAALSVTSLYKIAANDQKEARDAGYQEALDDILTFLDRENIGLDDGEGWRVRQWATERLDGSPPIAAASESDDERTEDPVRLRSASPTAQRTVPQDQPREPSRPSSPAPSPPPLASIAEQTSAPPALDTFTFRSQHIYPQEMDTQSTDRSETAPSSPPVQAETMPSPTVRLGLVSRGTRASNRNARNNLRSTANGRVSSGTTGSKRKLPFVDYFDISGLGDGKDQNGGGGKKGRFA